MLQHSLTLCVPCTNPLWYRFHVCIINHTRYLFIVNPCLWFICVSPVYTHFPWLQDSKFIEIQIIDDDTIHREAVSFTVTLQSVGGSSIASGHSWLSDSFMVNITDNEIYRPPATDCPNSCSGNGKLRISCVQIIRVHNINLVIWDREGSYASLF